MTTNIATTREQSARLLQCGVDPETADMVWTCFESDDEQYDKLGVMDEFAYEFSALKPIPAWSLSALLNLMPRTVTHKGRTNIFGLYHEEEKDGGGWNYSCPGIVYFTGDTPFEAVIKMIEWLTANNYKLNQL